MKPRSSACSQQSRDLHHHGADDRALRCPLYLSHTTLGLLPSVPCRIISCPATHIFPVQQPTGLPCPVKTAALSGLAPLKISSVAGGPPCPGKETAPPRARPAKTSSMQPASSRTKKTAAPPGLAPLKKSPPYTRGGQTLVRTPAAGRTQTLVRTHPYTQTGLGPRRKNSAPLIGPSSTAHTHARTHALEPAGPHDTHLKSSP